ncbi:MAG: hypothetical protein JST28_01795 [Acidobacteria bacterium]|nr:hypothetical protein [Acidobacteriota bacterium]
MLRRCLHTIENGQRCNAPATDTSKYCRHHNPQSPARAAQETETEPIHLPLIVDRPSALAALNTVMQALGEGCIKRSAADTLLSAIKLAVRLIAEMAEAGETLSPATFALRPQPMPSPNHYQPAQTEDKLAIAMAAAGEGRKPNPFSTAHPSSSFETDPATARMIKEILAQSRDFPRSQQPGV